MWGPCLSPPVADQPLSPATRHCLGRPLPYQQADRTQAPPSTRSYSLYSRLHFKKILNPKPEIRNNFQNTNDKKFKKCLRHLRLWTFEFVLNFVLSASNFLKVKPWDYGILPSLSGSYLPLGGRFLCITHPFAAVRFTSDRPTCMPKAHRQRSSWTRIKFSKKLRSNFCSPPTSALQAVYE